MASADFIYQEYDIIDDHWRLRAVTSKLPQGFYLRDAGYGQHYRISCDPKEAQIFHSREEAKEALAKLVTSFRFRPELIDG